MVRTAQAAKTTSIVARKPKVARPKNEVAVPPIKPTKPSPAPKRVVIAAAPPAPKLSKDELRAQVNKLEHTVATIRAKRREANKSAKIATARIAKLEAQVAGFEKVALEPAPAQASKTSPGPASVKRKSRKVDQGQSEPGAAALDEPAASEQEAETT